jgi:hypothetical protein
MAELTYKNNCSIVEAKRLEVESSRHPRDNDQPKQYLCRAASPNPWKIRDAIIDEVFGLTAHQMLAMNI